MKKTIIIAVMLFSMVSFAQESISERVEVLIPALIQVESGGDWKAIGDKGKAYGGLQLWKIYIKDVNRIARTNYTHNDAFDEEKAKEIVRIYLINYGKRYERLTGKTATYEVLSRIHNGGPNGWKKESTIKYWNKVKDKINL